MSKKTPILRSDLNELKRNLDGLKRILVNVATGGDRIQDVEQPYAELVERIDRHLSRFAVHGMDPKWNIFRSLWDWHAYWSKYLKTYADRRSYVSNVFDGLLAPIERALATSHDEDVTNTLRLSFEPKAAVFSIESLHPSLVSRCKKHFEQGQFDDAILNGMKLIESELRKKSGLSAEEYGVSLVNAALCGKNPSLLFPNAKTQSEKEAVQSLFRGAVGALKNPLSHRFIDERDPVRAFEALAFISWLLRLLDTSSDARKTSNL
jgi:uncharacterized protein (TIGR02391 family)